MHGGTVIAIAVGQREAVTRGVGVCDAHGSGGWESCGAHGSGGWESCGASRSSPVIVWGVVVLR